MAAVHAPAPAPPASQGRLVDWRDMASDAGAWEDLATRASEPNPFHEAWYLLPALRALDGAGRVRLFRFEAGGALAGILPIRPAPRYYRWPLPNVASWVHDNCFCGMPLVAAGFERPFWRTLLAALDQSAGPSLFLHLRAMPLAGPVHDALMAELAGQRRHHALVHREERALLASDLSPEGYFEASLTGKKRKELRRQFARLSEQGALAIEREAGAAGIADWAEAFLALEASGWKGRAGSAMASHPGTAMLAREALRGAAERDRLERLTLRLDDRPIAMLATFLSPPGAFSWKTAFDERYARFSPGVLLQREYMAVLSRKDIVWTDSCASADHPMIDHIWRERRAMGRLSIAIGGRFRRGLFRRIADAEAARGTPAVPTGDEP